MKVFIDDKEWYSGNVCCDEPFHFKLEVAWTQQSRRRMGSCGFGIAGSNLQLGVYYPLSGMVLRQGKSVYLRVMRRMCVPVKQCRGLHGSGSLSHTLSLSLSLSLSLCLFV